MATVEELRARVAAYAPGTKAKGLIGDALTAAAGSIGGRVVDAALAHCLPARTPGQGLAVIGTDALTVVHATKKAPAKVWLLPWADIAPLSEHEGNFTFASAVDGLEGVSIFASGAQSALRQQVEVTARGLHRQYRDVAVLGGLPGQTHPRTDIRLVFNDEGIAVESERQRLALLSWDTIAGVTVEGPTEARKRVTVTRIIALGVFALAVPKSESVSYLIVSLGPDGEAAFEIRGVGPHQVRADLLPFASKVRANQPGAAGVVPDLKMRLRRLDELRDEDLISDSEYQEQRARILAEL